MLKRILPLAGLAATIASSALAQFKRAPGTEQEDAGWGVEFDPGLEGDAQLYFETAKEFLLNYYGYLGVLFVLLCLAMFGRGDKAAKRKKAERARRIREGTYHDIQGIDDLLEEDARTG